MKAILTSLCTFMSITLLMWACGTTDPDVGGNTNTGGGDNGGSSSGTENSDATCDDGADNDGNGYTDCADFGARTAAKSRSVALKTAKKPVAMVSTTTEMVALIAKMQTVELALRPVDQTRQHSSSAPMVSITVVTVLQTAKTAIASNSLATLKAVIPATRTPQKPAQTVSIMIMTPTLTAMT